MARVHYEIPDEAAVAQVLRELEVLSPAEHRRRHARGRAGCLRLGLVVALAFSLEVTTLLARRQAARIGSLR